MFAAAEAEAVTEELGRFDVDLPAVEIEGGCTGGASLRADVHLGCGPATVMQACTERRANAP